MAKRLIKIINPRAVSEPQTIGTHNSRKENQGFRYKSYLLMASEISASIVDYHRTYLAVEVVQIESAPVK